MLYYYCIVIVFFLHFSGPLPSFLRFSYFLVSSSLGGFLADFSKSVIILDSPEALPLSFSQDPSWHVIICISPCHAIILHILFTLKIFILLPSLFLSVFLPSCFVVLCSFHIFSVSFLSHFDTVLRL